MGRALAATILATMAPGAGHLLLRRRRTGAPILAAFVLLVGAGAATVGTVGRGRLLAYALDTQVLLGVAVGCAVAGVLWIAVVIRTYAIARPRRAGALRTTLGGLVVAMLCVVVAAPLAFAAQLAQSQRTVVNALFPAAPVAGAAKPTLPARVNVLMFGSDAGSDRTGTRSDSIMVASIDTTTSRAVLFGLPRNIEHAPFPPGSAMAAKFPHGFFDPSSPLSGEYLLNAEYTYGNQHPELAPATPTTDRGLNLLMSSVGQMLGIPVDYYAKVDMAGFAAVIDAIGGVTVDVGPVPLPIGGVLPDGTHVKPDGYVPAGVQHLNGEQALWYARSRRDSDDYNRMGRQRCLIEAVLAQKSPTDLLAHFQSVAAATTDSITTNIPQAFLPALAALDDNGRDLHLDSVAFAPSLADPHQADGRFDPSNPDFAYMRQVVAAAIAGPTATPDAPGPSTAAAAGRAASPATSVTAPPAAGVLPLAESCSSPTGSSSVATSQ